MTDILSIAMALIILISGLVLLVVFVRQDRFAGPGTGHTDTDELGSVVFGRRRPGATLR